MGHLVIEDSYIPQLNRKRKIRIYLPEDYYDNNDKYYPVIYMHDGQNVFEDITSYIGVCWAVKNTMELFEISDLTDGIIVVAVDHGDSKTESYRIREYSIAYSQMFTKKLKKYMKSIKAVCEGEQYADFIVNTLKPDIDTRYRTLSDIDNTALIGSSAGANISLYITSKYPQVFSKVGILSPALWISEKELFEHIEKSGININAKYYISVGTKEEDDNKIKDLSSIYVDSTKRLEELIKSKGIKEESVKLFIEEGGFHNEACWAPRFKDFVRWAFDLGTALV